MRARQSGLALGWWKTARYGNGRRAGLRRGKKALNDGPRVALIWRLHHHAMITIYYIKGPSCLGGLLRNLCSWAPPLSNACCTPALAWPLSANIKKSKRQRKWASEKSRRGEIKLLAFYLRQVLHAFHTCFFYIKRRRRFSWSYRAPAAHNI